MFFLCVKLKFGALRLSVRLSFSFLIGFIIDNLVNE